MLVVYIGITITTWISYPINKDNMVQDPVLFERLRNIAFLLFRTWQGLVKMIVHSMPRCCRQTGPVRISICWLLAAQPTASCWLCMFATFAVPRIALEKLPAFCCACASLWFGCCASTFEAIELFKGDKFQLGAGSIMYK